VQVELVVTGTAPEGVDIQYHAGPKPAQGPNQINGNATRLPWRYSAAYNPKAKYISMDAGLYGTGSVNCKLVVDLPDGRSLTVTDHASGKFGGCAVEAEPTDASALHWRKV
jgi:hypothetical protein